MSIDQIHYLSESGASEKKKSKTHDEFTQMNECLTHMEMSPPTAFNPSGQVDELV